MNTETPRSNAAEIDCKDIPTLGYGPSGYVEIGDMANLERELTAALAENDRMKADAERMEWLESQFNRKFRHSIFIADDMSCSGINFDRRGEGNISAPTVREAIDAARKLTPANPLEK
jgi:hypothetical protein